MSAPLHIMWFRQDLRLSDNPALTACAKDGARMLPIFILDDDNAGDWKRGAASRWWLHHSLQSLYSSLDYQLQFFTGDAQSVLDKLIKTSGATAVYWNRAYEPWRIKRDKAIKQQLKDTDIEAHSFNGSLLFEPHEVTKDDGDPYRVFSPFFKYKYKKGDTPRSPLDAPQNLTLHRTDYGCSLEELALLPEKDWGDKLAAHCDIGEDAAKHKLHTFLASHIDTYKEARDKPALDATSQLSPHLHHGEISPNQVWHAVLHYADKEGSNKGTEHFLSEVGWREFCHNLLYHFPHFPDENYQEKFKSFPWQSNKEYLSRWQRGQTGYPIVDAGMRQLWETGWMHNRVRMITASFLIKDLMIDWRDGQRWFWDTLVDADLANNSAGWQWVAGSGADAAPYFRIFNPIMQGERFDPEGAYIRKFIPELAKLDNRYIHKPWEADDGTLEKAGITLGKNYPEPIVNHFDARDEALKRYKAL